MVVRIFALVLGLAIFNSTLAAPTQISAAQFGTLMAGGRSTVERFSGFSVGIYPSPMVLANGTFTGTPMLDLAPWCSIAATNKCLDIGFADAEFSQFANGTTLWGATIYYAGSGDQLQVTVSGKGGVSSFMLPPGAYDANGTFVGFFDAEGLTSVTFHRLSPFGFNLAFDDVTTAAFSIPSVPAPALSSSLLATLSALLILIGCLSLKR